MPVKRARARTQTKASVDQWEQRLAQVEAELSNLRQARVNVRREDHEEEPHALRRVEDHTRRLERATQDLNIQFKRIAQMQVELDEVKWALNKMKSAL